MALSIVSKRFLKNGCEVINRMRKIYRYLGLATLEDLQALVVSANSALEAMRKRAELHESQIQAMADIQLDDKRRKKQAKKMLDKTKKTVKKAGKVGKK